ncbi:MAG: archaeosortase A [Archaeoglobaceae archaeon]
MLPEFIALIALVFMVLYVLTKNKFFGAFCWFIFAIASFLKGLEFVNLDNFNAALFILASIFFILLGKAAYSLNSRTLIEVTSFSAFACAMYLPFVFFEPLNAAIIEKTANLTSRLGNLLGFPVTSNGKILELGESYVEIILPCTAIESISLFTGATLGIKADFSRKLKAFLISVPIIYFLNLLRNLFVLLSYTYSWFGEESFYIAHHVISKILAMIALLLISYAVFRILPELAELIYSLKSEIMRGVKID